MNIELAGASGVGKTTAINNISDTLYSFLQVASGNILQALMTEREQEQKKQTPLFYSSWADEGAVFGCDDFISQYLSMISVMRGKDSQKIMLVKLIDKHRKDYLVRQQLREQHLLIDEGLIHASFPLSQFSLQLESDIDFFISNIPLPDVVIQLHAEPERIFKRIKSRGKLVNSYRYIDDSALMCRLERVEYYLTLMEKILIQRGCRVRHVDANGPVKDWAQGVLNIVKEEIEYKETAPNQFPLEKVENFNVLEAALGLDFSLPEDKDKA